MAETRQVYKFDRFRHGKKMAEGATITRCTNPEDAAKEAARLFGNHPYESFVLRAAETRPNEYLLELIDILARPIQDGGEGMADNQDSPLMRLREKIAEGKW